MPELYAQAIWNMSRDESANAKNIVAKISAHLKSSGRLKLLPHILVALKKIGSREAKLASVVEVASEGEATKALKAAAAAGIHAEKAKVNHSLINGWRAISKEKLVDHSSKRMLLDLYQAVTR